MKRNHEFPELLKLSIPPNTPIFFGKTNDAHIQKHHPYEYETYLPYMESILALPDYIGQNPKDGSILYVKYFETNSEFIRVAVRISTSKKWYAKTLHLLSTCNAEKYIAKGTLKKLDTVQKSLYIDNI